MNLIWLVLCEVRGLQCKRVPGKRKVKEEQNIYKDTEGRMLVVTKINQTKYKIQVPYRL